MIMHFWPSKKKAPFCKENFSQETEANKIPNSLGLIVSISNQFHRYPNLNNPSKFKTMPLINSDWLQAPNMKTAQIIEPSYERKFPHASL